MVRVAPGLQHQLQVQQPVQGGAVEVGALSDREQHPHVAQLGFGHLRQRHHRQLGGSCRGGARLMWTSCAGDGQVVVRWARVLSSARKASVSQVPLL